MKHYDLLAQSYTVGKIPNHVFADISFDKLLAKYLGAKQTANILAVIGRPLSAEGIKLRQELLLDLEKEEVAAYLSRLKLMVQDLELSYNAYHQQENPFYKLTAFLDFVEKYASFVETICDQALKESLTSRLLQGFTDSFTALTESADFQRLKGEAADLREKLKSIGSVQVTVNTPDGVPIAAALNRKKQSHLAEQLMVIAEKYSEGRGHRRASRRRELSMSFLTGLFRLYPQLFAQLERFHEQYQYLLDNRLFAYRNQFAFYLDLRLFFTAVGKAGIPLCMPKNSAARQTIIKDAYDVTLLLKTTSGIVPNDIEFSAESGFYVLTGANSGGKTAYLRAVALCHILFCAGGYVPAREAQIYPFTKIFTQFPADESRIEAGRLEDEQRKIEAIVAAADDDTLVLLNETFSSTSEELSLDLCSDLVARLCQAGAYGLFVTHHHQLPGRVAQLSVKTRIGFLSAVVLDDAAKTRTYKISRQRQATGSYAQTILEKYGLTCSQLTKRLLEVQ